MKQYENITNLHLIANFANTNKQIEIDVDDTNDFIEEFLGYDFKQDFSFVSLQIEENEEIQTLKGNEAIEFINKLIEAYEEDVNNLYAVDFLGFTELENEAIEYLSDILDEADEMNVYGSDLIVEYQHMFEMIYHNECFEFISKYPVDVEIALNEYIDNAGVEALLEKDGHIELSRFANIALYQTVERVYFNLAHEFEEETGREIINCYPEYEDMKKFNIFVKNTIKKIEGVKY